MHCWRRGVMRRGEGFAAQGVRRALERGVSAGHPAAPAGVHCRAGPPVISASQHDHHTASPLMLQLFFGQRVPGHAGKAVQRYRGHGQHHDLRTLLPVRECLWPQPHGEKGRKGGRRQSHEVTCGVERVAHSRPQRARRHGPTPPPATRPTLVQGGAFDPATSNTSSWVTCASPDCDCGVPRCGCSDNVCSYTRTYAEQSSSSGVLVKDALHLHDGAAPAPVVFGCETRETGEIFRQRADGLLGLGRSPNSLLQQLVTLGEVDNAFSICFGSVDGEGALVLGSGGLPQDVGLQVGIKQRMKAGGDGARGRVAWVLNTGLRGPSPPRHHSRRHEPWVGGPA